MTLLELLAATSLLALVAVAIATWVGAQTRLAWKARQSLARVGHFAETLRLLEDDLLLSQSRAETPRVRVVERSQCDLLTRHAPPGDRQGLIFTRWRYDAERDILWRERAGDISRPVAAGLGPCSFRWLADRMAVEFTAGAEPDRLVGVVAAEMRP